MLWRDVMTPTLRDHLVGNIVAHLSNDVTDEVQSRAVQYWGNVDLELGRRVGSSLGRSLENIEDDLRRAS
jgi:catalase